LLSRRHGRRRLASSDPAAALDLEAISQIQVDALVGTLELVKVQSDQAKAVVLNFEYGQSVSNNTHTHMLGMYNRTRAAA
jgi:hypothetical protein